MRMDFCTSWYTGRGVLTRTRRNVGLFSIPVIIPVPSIVESFTACEMMAPFFNRFSASVFSGWTADVENTG